MKLVMKKEVQAHTIIEGFPGFGLVGTIVTEYLLDHLECELIGTFESDDLPPTVAIHKGEIIHPMGVFYNEKYNLIILHAILDIAGLEWEMAQCVTELAQKTNAKEMISIEGVSAEGEDNTLYYFGNKEFEKLGAKPIEESVVMGITATLLLKQKDLSCLFAQTNSKLPDSRAAAKIIEFLDTHLNLEVDPKPLLMQAELFEKKVSGIMQKTQKVMQDAHDKQMSYLG